MSIPDLPTNEQVYQNFEQWEKFFKELESKISHVRQHKLKMDHIAVGKNTIRSLFNQYVKPNYPDKFFNADSVCVAEGRDSYTYDYDGVDIYYLGRMTWCIDDYDYFQDRRISVNGAPILKETMA